MRIVFFFCKIESLFILTPPIFLGNVQTLNNKVGELCARTKFISDYRNAYVLCFSETWLKPDTPNTHVEPDGFIVYRGDRKLLIPENNSELVVFVCL